MFLPLNGYIEDNHLYFTFSTLVWKAVPLLGSLKKEHGYWFGKVATGGITFFFIMKNAFHP